MEGYRRDPDYTVSLGKLIAQALALYPEWRVGQLIENAAERSLGGLCNLRLVYDEVLERGLQLLISDIMADNLDLTGPDGSDSLPTSK